MAMRGIGAFTKSSACSVICKGHLSSYSQPCGNPQVKPRGEHPANITSWLLEIIRQHFVDKLISVCTKPCTGYVAILNKRTTSSHQRSIRLSRQTLPKHSSDRHFSSLPCNNVRISRQPTAIHHFSSHTQHEEKKKIESRKKNLMQDIRKFP